jgi:hypothetical protein
VRRGCPGRGGSVAAEQAGGLLRRGALTVADEVASIVRGVVGVALQPPVEVMESRQLGIEDGSERDVVTGGGDQRPEVVEAERDASEERRPRRVGRSISQASEGRLHGRRSLAADPARWTTPGGVQPGAPASTSAPDGIPERRQPALEHGTVQDRRSEAARGAPIGIEQLAGMASTERVIALEAGSKSEVEDALGDDRVQGRALRPGADGADRTTAAFDRVEKPDVDEVPRRRPPLVRTGHGRAPGRRRWTS